MAETSRPRVRPWAVLAAGAAMLAGLLFAASASTARGTDLRSGRRLQLTELIARERSRSAALDSEARELRREVLDVTRSAAERDGRVQAARRSAARLEGAAGLTAVQGPGVEVTLDDAVYSPPFVMRGIGDEARLRDALDAAPGVALFRTYVDAFGLGYSVAERDNLVMPAYDGQLRLTSAVDR